MHLRAALMANAAAFACTAWVSSPALAIDTYPRWDGSQSIQPFGCPNTTTYGEVITVPASKHHMRSFSFSWQNDGGSTGSMVVRGEVYAWDGTKAAGNSLYESKPMTISFDDTDFHEETFMAAIPVTPGARYVVFASIDKDYDKCTNDYLLDWGSVDARSKGNFVYQNNSGVYGNWTTQAWTHFANLELAFRATMTP